MAVRYALPQPTDHGPSEPAESINAADKDCFGKKQKAAGEDVLLVKHIPCRSKQEEGGDTTDQSYWHCHGRMTQRRQTMWMPARDNVRRHVHQATIAVADKHDV